MTKPSAICGGGVAVAVWARDVEGSTGENAQDFFLSKRMNKEHCFVSLLFSVVSPRLTLERCFSGGAMSTNKRESVLRADGA